MQIDSLPVEIDEIERRIMQLEIERQATVERKRCALERAAQADRKGIGGVEEDSSGRKARWQAEKEAIGKIRKLKEQIEQLKAEEQKYERRRRTGQSGGSPLRQDCSRRTGPAAGARAIRCSAKMPRC